MNRRALATLFVALLLAGARPAYAADPRDVFYSDIRAGHDDAAITVAAPYVRAHPLDDRFALDYAYALLRAKQTAAGDAVLSRLALSAKDPAIRAKAQTEQNARRTIAAAPSAPVAAATPAPAIVTPEAVATPDPARALLQTAYDRDAAHDPAGAVTALDAYLALVPGDEHARLQRAYELKSAGHAADADAQFNALSSTATDPAIRKTALTQAMADRPLGAPRFENFSYAQHSSRFADTFYGGDTRYRLTTAGPVTLYAVSHLTNDTRSGAPGASDVYNDNVLILGTGASMKLTPNITAFAEAGQAIGLAGAHSETDLRFGLTGGRTIAGIGGKPRTDFSASIAHYSRYVDTIAYATISHEIRLGNSPLRAIAGSDVVLDTNRLYYNNAADVFGGLVWRDKNLTLRLTAQAGRYLDRAFTANRSFTSIQPALMMSFSR